VFFASLVFNTLVAGVVFALFGGVKLLRGERPEVATAGPRPMRRAPTRRVPRVMGGSQEADAMPPRAPAPLTRLTPHQMLTLIGLVVLVAVTLIFDVDVGLVAISVAVVLTLTAPQLQKEAVNEIKWPVVLLICGVLSS
jgi:Na+/H+ antiporter NhaD/arsenite permease-like protein